MENQSIGIVGAPSKFPTFSRLPAEIRLQIWETHLAASASEPILATPYHYNCSQPILCISPLLAVSHEARCAARSWAHTHRQHHQRQRDSMGDGHRIRNCKEKSKMENSPLEGYPGSFFRPINTQLDVHFFPGDLPDLLNWRVGHRPRARVQRDMFLRQRAERQASGSALLYPSLPGPEHEQVPEVLLPAPFNSLPLDRRIKHVAISAGHLAPCLDDAGLAELWKMFRMEVLFVILPLPDDDGPWYYRTVWRYGVGDPSSGPLPPYRLGCGCSVGFQVRSRTLGLNLNLKPSVRLGLYLTPARRRRSRSKG
jgi:hypothetical protein